MLVTNHVLSGALIGAATGRPEVALGAGIASHFVLDAVPHWGDWGNDTALFMRVAVRDGLTGLAVMGAFAAVAPPRVRLAVVAGMVGAALPDLDKPSKMFFGRSPFPRVVDNFHGAIQREARGRFPMEAAVGAGFAAAAIVALVARAKAKP